jgi:non-specific serine/threonine protein kinase/serine/threonine-protein kinase
MTPDRWQQINDLFAEALRRGTGERTAYLDGACNSDQALRSEVEHLFEQDAGAERDGFLVASRAIPLSTLLAVRPQARREGLRIGPYEVRELIARGGMGDVYRATRVDDYRQEVAIKLLRPGLNSDEFLARFQTERQVLAGLQHPHIARLLDGGTTEDGLPYLVMEYIDGQPIDRHCDARQLSLRDRVQLFRLVCLAVQHAHEQTIVHRDRKPGNVLVTADGTPRLTDFGLAKQLADVGQTHTGEVLGTPSYMAPEQARSRLDAIGPRTDIYGLGALLYHLLTGHAPFKGATLHDTLEQVCSQEPVSPARLIARLPRDLDTITLKCLQKDPGRRYASAAELADDLGRFLEGVPIKARPIGPVERLIRWCRRNAKVAGLLAALVVVLVSGISALTVLWLVARAEKKEADRQRLRAEARQELARRTVDDLLRMAEKWMDHEPGMTSDQLEALEKALATYHELAREDSRDPRLRFRTAQAYHFVARIQARLGRHDRAEEALGQQIVLLEELVTELPDEPKYRYDLFHCLQARQGALGNLGRLSELEEVVRRSHALIEEMVRDFPDQPLYRDSLAHSHIHMGSMLARRGQLREAVASYREGVRVAQALVREYPNWRRQPFFGRNVGGNRRSLASVQIQMGQLDQAEESYRLALADYRQVLRLNPEDPNSQGEVAGVLSDLGNLLRKRSRLAQAQECYQEALSLWEKLARSYPRVPSHPFLAAQMCSALGQLHHDAGRPQQAEEAFGRAITTLEQLLAKHPHLKYLSDELARLLTTCPLTHLRNPTRARQLAR